LARQPPARLRARLPPTAGAVAAAAPDLRSSHSDRRFGVDVGDPADRAGRREPFTPFVPLTPGRSPPASSASVGSASPAPARRQRRRPAKDRTMPRHIPRARASLPADHPPLPGNANPEFGLPAGAQQLAVAVRAGRRWTGRMAHDAAICNRTDEAPSEHSSISSTRPSGIGPTSSILARSQRLMLAEIPHDQPLQDRLDQLARP
jgi:hypothetical protein